MIRVRDLVKTYGDVRAVDGVSFRVAHGEVVGFLGPNGAGKSTTMRILTGLLQPDVGGVEIDGRAVSPDDPRSRESTGYLPETTPLYGRMRVAEYLDFVGSVRGLSRGRRAEALERVLADCALEGWERRRIAELSKGYRQRVGLAQALFSDPPVLVLDEPTSGLDPAEIARIRALIHTLGRTKTILLSTHVLSEVQETCRRVIILARGRIVADGTPLDLAEEEEAELRVVFAAAGGVDAQALACVAGVLDVRPSGEDDAGRVGFALRVDDRYAAAQALVARAGEAGWTLYELRHELPSLEHVFLRRTESFGAPAEPLRGDQP